MLLVDEFLWENLIVEVSEEGLVKNWNGLYGLYGVYPSLSGTTTNNIHIPQ